MPEATAVHHSDLAEQHTSPARWWVLGAVVAALLAVFLGRTYLARVADVPRLPDLFETLIITGSAIVLVTGYRSLTVRDWLVGMGLGLFLGLQVPFATLFQPFPYLDLIRDDWSQAFVRGSFTAIAALGGLVIMRRGGPVQLRLAGGAVAGRVSHGKALVSLAFGALIGIPLAVLNAFANAWTQGRSVQWQSPLAAATDALQPAIFEEILFRLALLGLLWLILRRAWPARQAAWLAGILALLVHTYGAHFSDEFITQPLAALAMGAVMGLIWGLPLTILALRRDLDSATGFHWVQDFARFWAGF